MKAVLVNAKRFLICEIPPPRELAGPPVPDQRRVHTVEFVLRAEAPRAPSMDEDLGVGVVGLEAVAECFEFFAQVAVVVDAAVEGDGDEVGAGRETGGVDCLWARGGRVFGIEPLARARGLGVG